MKENLNSMFYNFINKIRRRLSLVPVKFRKILRWQFNNSPFLSGDTFADSVDVNYFPNRWRIRSVVQYFKIQKIVIFTQGEYLEATLDKIRDTETRIVVAGNSDRNYHNAIPNIPKNIEKIYLQNLNFQNPKYAVLPIGLENFRLGKNGNPRLFQSKHPWNLRLQRTLVGPFTITHKERLELTKFKYTEGPWDFYDDFQGERQYRSLCLNYKFVACPQGNGIDTHRFWESLYSGSYPVVKESPWSENVSELGIPFLTVSDWTVDELLRISKIHVAEFNTKDLKPLWISYWRGLLYEDN